MRVSISVDQDLDLAPYEQIYEQIQAAIERGELESGAVLPTVRQLARDLNVAPNTVARAYVDLQSEGWLVSDGRRGTHVADRFPATRKGFRSHALRDRVKDFVRSLLSRGYTHDEILREIQRFTT